MKNSIEDVQYEELSVNESCKMVELILQEEENKNIGTNHNEEKPTHSPIDGSPMKADLASSLKTDIENLSSCTSKTLNTVQERTKDSNYNNVDNIKMKPVNGRRRHRKRRTFLFEKVLTSQDFEHKLTIPTSEAKKHMPIIRLSEKMFKTQIITLLDYKFEDWWTMKYKYCERSQTYYLTEGWGFFVYVNELKTGDTVRFYKLRGFDTKYYGIGFRRQKTRVCGIGFRRPQIEVCGISFGRREIEVHVPNTGNEIVAGFEANKKHTKSSKRRAQKRRREFVPAMSPLNPARSSNNNSNVDKDCSPLAI